MKHGLGLRYAAFGPLEVADLGGLDVFNNIASYLFADLATHKESFGELKRLAEAGHYGVKNGKGFEQVLTTMATAAMRKHGATATRCTPNRHD